MNPPDSRVSNMESPSETEPWFERFRIMHRQIFMDHQFDELLTVEYATEVHLGQPLY